MQAAFISSYLHSAIIYVAVLLFAYTVYLAADYPLGSISQVYDNLTIRAQVHFPRPLLFSPACWRLPIPGGLSVQTRSHDPLPAIVSACIE